MDNTTCLLCLLQRMRIKTVCAFIRLLSVATQLTSAIQGNTSLPYNPVPIGNTNLEADDPSDALSEVSI